MNILRYVCGKFQKLPFSVMESIWSGAIPPRAITKRPALPLTMTADSWGVGPFETASWGEVFPTVIQS